MALLYTPTITYDPVTDPYGRKANHYKIERSIGDGFIYKCLTDPSTGFPTPFAAFDSIIISIAGAYKSDKFVYPGPRGGFSVFVGPGSSFNISGAAVPKVNGHFMSVNRSELLAAITALKIALHVMEKGLLPSGRLRNLIIKTESETLTKNITDRIWTWMRKGWIACGNSRVRDWDLWEEMLYMLQQVQGHWGADVHFWWVPRSWNREAGRDAHIGTRIPPPVKPPQAGNGALCAYSNQKPFEITVGGMAHGAF